METTSKKLNLFNNSCLDLLRRESQSINITTGHKSLDRYLGGGIALRRITELVGNSGTGKTKMCMQLCLNVQIPKSAGGLEGAALFIDTRQDLHPDRLQELAKDLERRYRHRAPDFQASKMLQNIHYVSCPNATQLMATVLSARRHLIAHPNIKVIVIDSLAFSLRMLADGAQRFDLLLELLESMRRLLRTHQVAWVVTNVLTNRCIGDQFHVVPALGDLYSHLINERIWFSRSGHYSLGKLWKASRLIKD